jgi:hypothetical protein
MTSAQDRAKAILADLNRSDLSIVSISDAEIISTQIDRYEGMTFLRAFGAAYFAASTKGVSKKAKEAAELNLRGHLVRIIG